MSQIIDCDISIYKLSQQSVNKSIVLKPSETYTLVIDYPLSQSAKFVFNVPETGINTLDLIQYIATCYLEIYSDANRHGVWGHDIYDLQLVEIKISNKNVITILVDS